MDSWLQKPQPKYPQPLPGLFTKLWEAQVWEVGAGGAHSWVPGLPKLCSSQESRGICLCCTCSFRGKGIGIPPLLSLAQTLEMIQVLEWARCRGPSLVADLWTHLLLGFLGASLGPFFLPLPSSLLAQSHSGCQALCF